MLLDDGIYQGSESSFYRVLKQADQLHHQGRSRAPKNIKAIIKELHHWRIKHKDKIPPKSKLEEAMSYSLNQFDKFQRYLEDGKMRPGLC